MKNLKKCILVEYYYLSLKIELCKSIMKEYHILSSVLTQICLFHKFIDKN